MTIKKCQYGTLIITGSGEPPHQLIEVDDLMNALKSIPGGYVYSGACSYQICFPLKNGGELRFCQRDDDQLAFPDEQLSIDLYSGNILPGVSGPAFLTGKEE